MTGADRFPTPMNRHNGCDDCQYDGIEYESMLCKECEVNSDNSLRGREENNLFTSGVLATMRIHWQNRVITIDTGQLMGDPLLLLLLVVDCRHVGKGKPALKYLARYLYRG